MKTVITVSAIIGGAVAQNAVWAQCGGIGFSGATSCASGSGCVKLNDYYSQCQPGAAATAPTPTTLATKPATVPTTTAAGPSPTTPASGTGTGTGNGGWKWLGVDESGAEFGNTVVPGVYGKNFIFPDNTALQTLLSQGYNAFRVPFLMERMASPTVSSPLQQAYLANYTATINYITQHGGWAVVDPHNFGRYNGAVITDTAGFKTFWQNLAATFKANGKVIFDTNNEYHEMDQALVLALNQAAIDGIRASGASSQYIFAEGNAWSGAWSWNTTNTNLAALTDPAGKLIYEMHQYLDSDSSGTSATCVSATVGVERIVGATAWLRANGKVGVLGEFAGGTNAVCQAAVKGLLDHLKANSDVWTGAFWWGGGPWWADYIYGYEPPSGAAYAYYNTLLKSYAP